jgi:hypothetical protein
MTGSRSFTSADYSVLVTTYELGGTGIQYVVAEQP